MAPFMDIGEQREVFIFPFQVGLPIRHKLVENFISAKMPGQDVLDVPRTYIGGVGRCYEHVSKRVEQRGGRPLFGWQLTMWPNRYIEAMHHVVWQNPDGGLEDLTAAPYVAVGNVAFVVDKRQDYRNTQLRGRDDVPFYGIAPSVRPIFLQIDTSDETQNFIKAFQRGKPTEQLMALLQAEPEHKGEAGTPCPCGSMLPFERCHARLKVPKIID